MATTTPNLGLTKPDPSGDDDAWGPMLNGNADILDAAVQAARDAAEARLPAAAVTAFMRTLLDDADATAARATLGALRIAALPIGTSLEYSGTGLPAGFLWEDGSNVSRTTYAELFAAIGTTYGAGNGSSTFALPDSRGRVAIGSDAMGGTAAGRITSAGCGIAGATLGAAGGNQALQAHAHGIADPGHGHGVADPGHGHGVYDPGHAHSLDRGVYQAGGSAGVQAGSGYSTDYVTPNTNGAGTGIGIYGNGTGIGIHGSGTGIGVQNAGAGGSQNVQPAIVKNKIIYTGVFA
jgi:hypothetical protein